ncbi:ECF RNA polymerase sigma factor SigW [Thermoflexales bacterium]|nr:ECF RNA polymerase sigma factor SigW [Thermoflexales bacterium]
MLSEDSDRVLLERLRRGDKSACAECIERHSPGVYRVALRLLGHEAEAEEVMQETFLSAFKAIDKFEGRAGLATWLYRIAHNAALMRLRRAQPEQVSVDDEEAFGEGLPVPTQLHDWCCLPERDFESSETRAALERAIHDLPEKLRVVFVMRELEGLSTEETAQALEISIDAAKVRLHRARLQLREHLSPYFTELAQTEA